MSRTESWLRKKDRFLSENSALQDAATMRFTRRAADEPAQTQPRSNPKGRNALTEKNFQSASGTLTE
jgi:hypothetical protein